LEQVEQNRNSKPNETVVCISSLVASSTSRRAIRSYGYLTRNHQIDLKIGSCGYFDEKNSPGFEDRSHLYFLTPHKGREASGTHAELKGSFVNP